jgi:hypothetical protein
VRGEEERGREGGRDMKGRERDMKGREGERGWENRERSEAVRERMRAEVRQGESCSKEKANRARAKPRTREGWGEAS